LPANRTVRLRGLRRENRDRGRGRPAIACGCPRGSGTGRAGRRIREADHYPSRRRLPSTVALSSPARRPRSSYSSKKRLPDRSCRSASIR